MNEFILFMIIAGTLPFVCNVLYLLESVLPSRISLCAQCGNDLFASWLQPSNTLVVS